MKLNYFFPLLLLSIATLWAQSDSSNSAPMIDTSSARSRIVISQDFLQHNDSTSFAPDSSKVNNNITVDSSINKSEMDSSKQYQSEKVSLTPLEKLQEPAIKALKQISFLTIINILVFLFIGVVLVKFVNKFSLGKNFIYFRSLKLFVKILIWVVILYIILHLLLEEPDNVIAYIILAIAVVFGVSTIPFFKNLVGGFYLTINVPFQPGDYISINKIEGEVKHINWRDTTIETTEGSIIFIPNLYFMEHPIENINKGLTEQIISLNLLFPATQNPELIKEIVLEAALSSPYTFTRKTPKVYLVSNDLLNKVYKFELQVYVKDGKFENDFIDSLNMTLSEHIFGIEKQEKWRPGN